MQNVKKFSARIDLWECAETWNDSPTAVGTAGETALNELAAALTAYGMGVRVKRQGRYATIEIDHMPPAQAETARTRRAGRPRTKATAWPTQAGTTAAERLTWCESMTLDELQAALGCSRRTAQRRVAELRAIAAK